MDDKTPVEPKPGIIVDMSPEDEIINVHGGVGDVRVQARINIKDKRIWAVIGLIVIIVAGLKATGFW